MDTTKLAPLLQRAADLLINAKTFAEIRDARNAATTAFVAAQEAERRIRDEIQSLIFACHKVQGEALKIESQAKIQLINEYDAAQKRGEVQRSGGARSNR